MARHALTTKKIESLKPAATKYGKPDGIIPGLQIIVNPSGSKPFRLWLRMHTRQSPITLGYFPEVSLAEARKLAQAALDKAADGSGDPVAESKQARADTLSGRDLLKNVIAEFDLRHLSKLKSRHEVMRMLKRDVLPAWGERRIQTIRKRDVIALLDAVRDRSPVGTMTNKLFSCIRKFFNWCIERDVLEQSPCQGVKRPCDERSRERILSDDELRLFWKAASAMSYPFGPALQLLCLTGQRRSEVGGMTFAELAEPHLWQLTAARTKNGSAHSVPLVPAAEAILQACPRIDGSEFVFTRNGRTAISGWSKAKRNLDKAMLALAQLENPDAAIDPWGIHDLRRTVASNMARLGIQLPVIEKVLNHQSGSFAGIVATYQRHSYADEKRHALQAWADSVERLVSGEVAGNVVRLGAKSGQ